MIESFRDDGFCVIKAAVAPATAAALRLRLEQRLPSAGRPLQRIVPRIIEQDQDAAEVATDTRLVRTLTDLFGVTPHLVCTYGHEKPAKTDSHTGPHSDVAHLPGVPHHQSLLMVKAMLALTPVRPGSGGTKIVPGSHRQPSRMDGQYIELDVGDMLLFHANAFHTATANNSDQPRLSLWFVYAQPWMRAFPGYEFSAEFVEGLRPRFAAQPHLPSLLGLTDPYTTVHR